MNARFMLTLTLRSLKTRRQAFILTTLCVIFSVTLLTALTGLDAGILSFVRKAASENGETYHFAFTRLEPVGLEKIARDFQKDPFFSSAAITADRFGETVLELTVRNPGPLMKWQLERRLKPYNIAQSFSHHNYALLETYGVIERGSQMWILLVLLLFPLALTVMCAVSILSGAFSLSGAEREREFGLLSCAGASGRRISSLVFLECALYWLLSFPIGLILGYLLLYSIETPVREGLLLGKVNFYETVLSPAIGIITGVGTALTLWFSCRKPAKRARKLRPISAIRQTAVILPPQKDADIPTFIRKRWGIVGVLAAQNRRRYRAGFRPAANLLTVCAALCVSLDGFHLAVREASDVLNADGSALMMNFGIGVTALLTAIGGLGLLLIVYGRLNEQKRELCLLRSAGLGLAVLRKLLLTESALRSAPPLLCGVIIGVMASYALHTLLESVSYKPPLAGIAAAAAVTLLQIIAATGAAMSEQKKTGITEGLRQDVV